MEEVRKVTHFVSLSKFLGNFFEALDGTQFLLCVVNGRGGGAEAGS